MIKIMRFHPGEGAKLVKTVGHVSTKVNASSALFKTKRLAALALAWASSVCRDWIKADSAHLRAVFGRFCPL